MSRLSFALPALATLSLAAAPLFAQSGQAVSGSSNSASYLQSQPAPIVRGTYGAPRYAAPRAPQVHSSRPAPGIFLRSAADAHVSTVSSGSDHVELRVEGGVANVVVRHPADNTQILVDLPAGQVDLLKDGVYTFNAGSNTVRVLDGEAIAYPGTNPDAKGAKVKAGEALAFGTGELHAVETAPAQERADLLPGTLLNEGHRGGYEGYGYAPYGYGPYGDGFYGYPYYAWGGPYGWGDPWGWGGPWGGWGWGYPVGFGVGFGYYGHFGRFGRRW